MWPQVISTAFIFSLGAAVGSFINSLVLRYGTGNSILRGRSRCFSCGKGLGWRELVPIFSYIAQGGRCAGCKSRISAQYMLVEIATGIVFLAVYFKNSYTPDAVYNLAIFAALIAIAAYDIRHKIIPDGLVYTFIFLSLAKLMFVWSPASIAAGIVYFIFFASLWYISNGRAMGLGDAKLALGIGFFLQYPASLWAMAFSFWIGGALGILLLICRASKVTLKSEVPFAPFLVAGALLAHIIF